MNAEQTKEPPTDILEEASAYVFELFKKKLSKRYVFHNYKHTVETVEICKEIAGASGVGEEDMEVLLLSAWLHDTGYIDTYRGHEKRSQEYAEEFLTGKSYPPKRIERVKRLIESTTKGIKPRGLLEEILHDADVINIGKSTFFSRAELLRVEWELFLNLYYTDVEWQKLQLNFLLNTTFLTQYASKKYGDQRGKNVEKQRQNFKDSKDDQKKSRKKKAKADTPRRGIETMYRATYRNHINLSSIADSKANMMISINTIIMSVIITVMGSGFTITGANFMEHVRFTVPIGILLVSSLVSVIFAVLSARPNVTSKKVNKFKLKNKKSSLLFFGNFSNMELAEFIDNMNELMHDKELLYDNMTIDLYFLGKVLTKKYVLLRISYGVFMAGLILCVLAFILIFVLSYNTINTI